MRFTPLVGTKVWFGPRGFAGWGWSPVSWEGWIACLIAIAVMVLGAAVGPPTGMVIIGAATAVLLVAAALKGTAPGGFSAARQFRAMRDYARLSDAQKAAAHAARRSAEDEPSVTDAAKRLRRFRRPGAS
jgi:hypothetical protein